MLFAPAQVVMIWDLARKDGPGAYGEGLAAPLGEMRWLDDLRGPVTFRRLHMGEHGDLRFPYHLLKHEVGGQSSSTRSLCVDSAWLVIRILSARVACVSQVTAAWIILGKRSCIVHLEQDLS